MFLEQQRSLVTRFPAFPIQLSAFPSSFPEFQIDFRLQSLPLSHPLSSFPLSTLSLPSPDFLSSRFISVFHLWPPSHPLSSFPHSTLSLTSPDFLSSRFISVFR